MTQLVKRLMARAGGGLRREAGAAAAAGGAAAPAPAPPSLLTSSGPLSPQRARALGALKSSSFMSRLRATPASVALSTLPYIFQGAGINIAGEAPLPHDFIDVTTEILDRYYIMLDNIIEPLIK